ncbi:hypothetical protein PENSPDRAFT_670442 [Peniophora sp. CONT]|nr:hypothetical protein PENSPDRAFT_670442 [Peniophora sp. CONT]
MNLSDTSYRFVRALVLLIGAGWLICAICWSWFWIKFKPIVSAAWSRVKPQTLRGWLALVASVISIAGILYLVATNTACVLSVRSPENARIVVVAPFQYSIIALPTLSQLAVLLEQVDRMRKTVEHVRTLARHQALDTLAKADFALYTAGANYVPMLTSAAATRVPQSAPRPFWKSEKQESTPTPPSPWPHGPSMALYHVTAPGYCWPFAGSEGFLGVRLARRVFVEEITIDHVAAELSWESHRRSAPRQMHLWGLVDGSSTNLQRIRSWEETGRILNYRKHSAFELGVVPDALQSAFRATGKWVSLASFRYDVAASNAIQTFAVDPDVRDLDVDFGTVVLIVSDNWGNTDFTCLYRVRIHGRTSQNPDLDTFI